MSCAAAASIATCARKSSSTSTRASRRLIGRSLAALLFDVTPSDPWSIAALLIGLLLACVLSGLIPALRATRVDPTVALRYE